MAITLNRLTTKGNGNGSIFGQRKGACLWRTVAVAICLIFTLAATAQAEFAGGSGTAEDPYLVATAEHLNNVRNHSLDNHFLQIADIDLGVAPWNEGEGWAPISSFRGDYNGQGHTISNLTINRAAGGMGLFNTVNAGTLRNMHLRDVQVFSSGTRVGGLAAQFGSESSVENSSVSGQITGNGAVGGVVGIADGGGGGRLARLHNVYADVVVQGGAEHTGGLVGQSGNNSGIIIRHSYSTGSVTGELYVGGLSGNLRSHIGSIADSYSHAAVTGNDYVGGLVGVSQGNIDRCFSTGRVIGTGEHVGGLLGGDYTPHLPTGFVRHSYWDTETSGQASSAGEGAVGLSTAEMKQRETYVGYNFNLLWSMGRGYPSFQDLTGYVRQQAVELSDLEGEGTEAAPYMITTADELAAMVQDLEAHYALGNDIDLRDTLVWDHGLGWTPIGSFRGSLDGRGHIVSNLTINNVVREAGLFVNTFAALRNIHLRDAHVRGTNVGALAAWLRGNVEHCSVTGQVSGVGHVGGVAGTMTGELHDVSADVDVHNSGENTGGLVGNYDGTMRHSYSRGTVTGTSFVGGLTGRFTGSIADSYSHAAVSGEGDHIGGLAGYAGLRTTLRDIPGSIHRTYSAGRVTGTGATVGGLLGHLYSGSVHLSFWDTETSGQESSAGGGAVGLSSAAMQQQETYRFFNFFNLWRIEQGKNYPAFQNLTGYAKPHAVTLADLDGQGTEEAPYIIRTVDELAAMAHDLEAHYRLGNNIDMRDTLVWDYGRGWTPISDFKGSLDGAGHVISHLTVNRMNDSAGLFKSLVNAALRDLHLRDVNISDSNSAGALGASISNTEERQIVNCSATGQVVAYNWAGGGLFGSASGSGLVISDSYAVVDVYGGERMHVDLGRAGGLIGHLNREATLKRSFAAGHVEGSWYVGGLVGRLDVSARIENSYSRASVLGKEFVGGLVGQVGGRDQWGYHDGFVQMSYSTGLVRVDGEEVTTVGGLVGHLVTDTAHLKKVTRSYWDRETSGQETSRGEEALGQTTDEMHAADFGWDFTNIWRKDADPWRNDGYPWLRDVTRSAVTIQVQADPNEHGRVSGAGTYLYGTTVVVRAAPEDGYAFINWTEGGQVVSTSPSYTFSATTNRNLVANFIAEEPVEYTITVSASPATGGTVSGGGTFEQDQQVTVQAVANTGYRFVNWAEGGQNVSSRASYTFTVTANRTLVANFVQEQPDEYTITVSASPAAGGTVRGGGTFEQGQQVTVTAVANTGYRFVNWAEGGQNVSSRASYTFTVTANRTLVANFVQEQPDEYTITVSANPAAGGTVRGGGTFAEGTNVTVMATPNTGYRFVIWTEGGQNVSGSASYTFTATANRNLVANFAVQEADSRAYIIAAFSGTGISYYNLSDNTWRGMYPFNPYSIAFEDLDGDGVGDFIGVWQGAGIWANLSTLNDWKNITNFEPDQIVTGDMTGNGRPDLIGSWRNFGIYYRDSITEAWPQLIEVAPQALAAGDVTGDGRNELVGSWAGFGLFKRDVNNNWTPIAQPAPPVLGLGDVTGNNRADYLCSWPQFGLYYLDSVTGDWQQLSSWHASMVTAGDLTGDGRNEVVAVFENGIWVHYVTTGQWERIANVRPTALTIGR